MAWHPQIGGADALINQGVMVDAKGSGEEEPKKHPCRRNSKGIPPNMSMVMVGKTGSGKSATGNTILGRKEFKSMLSDSSVTKTCEKRKGEVAGRHVFVVDTPGLFNTALPSEDIQKELGKCVALSAPGPHVFLLVMEASRFTEEEKRAVEIIQEIFGEGAANYTMVLFTHADQLGDKTIEEYIQGASKELRELVEKCGGRYHAFNNKNMSDRTQVTELLEKIDGMVAENGGSHYSCEMYQQVEAAIREKVEELKKQHEEDLLKKEEELKAKYHKEIDELVKQMGGKHLAEIKKMEERHKQQLEELTRLYEDKLRNVREKAEQFSFRLPILKALWKMM